MVDALTHIERTIRSMQESQDGYTKITDLVEPPPMCSKDSKADYEAVAWGSGINLLEALKQVN